MPDQAGHDRRDSHPRAFLHRPYAFLCHPCIFSLSSLRTRGSSVLPFLSYSEEKHPWMPDRGLSLTFLIEGRA